MTGTEQWCRLGIIVVMGVSGSGKSTVAALLARRIGATFVDGDAFHSPAHVAKMRAGQALDDDDRAPWLAAIAAWIDARLAAGEPGVIACSALRRAYRAALVNGRDTVRVVYLDGSRAVIDRRSRERSGHFMPVSLLDSQFAILQPPAPDENALAVGIDDPAEAIAATIAARLGLGSTHSDTAPGTPMDSPSSIRDARQPSATAPIALVISDVDGTLVTPDKRLTPSTIAAVRRLGEAGIGFTIASSRPPAGLRSLVAALGLTLPMGAFNGSTLVGPDLTVLSETLIPAPAARDAVRHLSEAGLDVWVFAHGHWNLRDAQAPYTDLERRTLGMEPTVVSDLAPLLDAASKIVGVGTDFSHVAACETRIAGALGEAADVHRSQAYYLDVTPAGAGKGGFVDAMAARLGLDRTRIATLGDAANDVPMFRRSGLSVAMGNAEDAVKAVASHVTASNEADGFAQAIAEFLLPR